ncbi:MULTISPECIES: aminotransferase class V-fold PLP-dependent enzyme [Streptomyces]|jgi:thiamine monophosphate synthase|uniref:aminotransferase class V-fold PLP-dependent enzyme n=1 Tax=unclassified Streptomyces TaxID=2593676 RepID=UPI0004C66965|nr:MULTISPECIES: aminotransferase class V-fold PLP-dependent enzyme [unclassified Streptomyces]MDX2732217.1 aminotransferase class V-fold PLP-dependent enzyme [Streptomyces sp. PA03-2a]MDX3766048.1 aminotransferase class V-fold PLP-dependent enzyme [Streptomyces sp. AK08-01B]MDX3815779.1 aminotransferase class V-fold PLP-dependent enzyme [Streptomyces sp. AK08-01A]SCZ15569.1 Aminotransferase class-V [Streptomyces sp. 136MFCol5.1]SFS59245.1 Aminotransferase class-V [Streptomyces sp. ok210]
MNPALPQTFPLATVALDDAIARQFRLLEATAAHFEGPQLFEADAGVVPGLGRPRTTARVEAVLADFFGAEDAAFVQGAGTGAIRAALNAAVRAGDPLLIHRAPVYRTTEVTLRGIGVRTVEVDFNDRAALREALASGRFRWAYVQHTRQRLADSYDPAEVLAACRAAGVRTLVDDNYAVMRTPAAGVELGADASCFSLFKLHGPEGIGVVVGARDLVGHIRRDNYSGGGQVQGHQALDALRALTHVPVMWAVQSQVGAEVAERLAAGEVAGVAEVRIANAQDRCLLVRLDRPVAKELPAVAARFGAAPYPVGSNSRYEIAPLFYRMSSSALDDAPELADWTVRINPMRAGADLVVDILRRSLAALGDRPAETNDPKDG